MNYLYEIELYIFFFSALKKTMKTQWYGTNALKH